jgi:hypothetical protein
MKNRALQFLLLITVGVALLTNFTNIVFAQSKPALDIAIPSSGAAAPAIGIMPPVTNSSNQLILGQNHYYSVVLRGNKEAIVYAKLVINNPDEATLNDFTFEMPDISSYEMVIYQQKLPQQCANYTYTSGSQSCTQYTDPDYNNSYYYSGTSQMAEYKKISYTSLGNTYHLNLAYPIQSYKSSALIISYATKSFVTESFGLFSFNFKTIKVSSRINDLKVSIDLDSDLILKGGNSTVNYTQTMDLKTSALGSAPEAVSSTSLDSLVSTIGRSGLLNKEAKNLAPNENYTVKGEYAASWWRLYLEEIVITILVIAVIIGGVILSLRYFKRKTSIKKDEAIDHTVSERSSQSHISYKIVWFIVYGLVSAVFVIAISYGSLMILSMPIFNYYTNQIPRLLLMMIILLLYILAIFGPALFSASKYGYKSVLYVIGFEIAWFILFLAIYLLLFQPTMSSAIYSSPVQPLILK